MERGCDEKEGLGKEEESTKCSRRRDDGNLRAAETAFAPALAFDYHDHGEEVEGASDIGRDLAPRQENSTGCPCGPYVISMDKTVRIQK